MNMTYDPQVDAMYLQLKIAKIARSEEIEPDIILDYDSGNNVLGVELLWVSCNFSNAFSVVESLRFANLSKKKECLNYLISHIDVSRANDPKLADKIDVAKKIFSNDNLIIGETKDMLEGVSKNS